MHASLSLPSLRSRSAYMGVRRLSRPVLASALCAALTADTATAQRISQFGFAHASADSMRSAHASLQLAAARPASGEQLVIGWMTSVLVGFAAWRAFDSPSGQHPKVRHGWGYTPTALTAMSVGSYVGATAGIWLSGRKRGASGSLLATAAGVALPTIPVLLTHDDPLLPLMIVVFWAPLQATSGYLAYKVSAKRSGALVEVDSARTLGGQKRSTDLILVEEIGRAAATNVYDAIARLRPEWLARETRSLTSSSQGGEPALLIAYFEDARYGPVDALRTLPIAGVQQIRYYDPTAATARYGTGHPAGVIAVSMAKP